MEPIILFREKEDCSGCGACVSVCPKQAIAMTEDELGVLYPVIDRNLCVGCGKCVRICTDREQSLQPTLSAYAALGKEEKLRHSSASGGVFSALAHSVVEQGGAVAGAVLDMAGDGADVFHIVSACPEDIAKMQGSKYAQSDATRCFADVIRAVNEGKTVLFSGTPCQVQAIKNLTSNPENLMTVDLICHGVPPVRMLREFLKLQSRRLGGKVEHLCFRDKSSPKPFTAKLSVSKGKGRKEYRIRSHQLSYYKYFLEGGTYRESCYRCPFAGMERAGDLTIGDYWGIEKFHADQIAKGTIPASNEISCVLVNTPKGEKILRTYGDKLELWSTQPDWVAHTNRQLIQPSEKHPNRQRLLEIYRIGGYPAMERQFIRENGGYLRFYYRLGKTIKVSK